MLKRFVQEFITNSARRSILVAITKARNQKLNLQDALHREQLCDMILEEIGGEAERVVKEGAEIMKKLPAPRSTNTSRRSRVRF
jgi:hypothetical protein